MKNSKRKSKQQPQSAASAKQDLIRWLHLIQKALTACLILTFPLLLYVFNTEYAITKIAFALVMISLLYALWGIQAWVQKELRLRLPPLFWPGVALVVVAGLSLINALNPAIGFQSFWILLYFFAFYVYVANLVHKQRDLQLFLGAALVAVLGAAFYGMLQYYGLLIGTINNISGPHTMISGLGNKNFLAEFLNGWFVPSLLFFIFAGARRWTKSSILFISAISFTAFFAADSMGALVGMAVSLVFFFVGMLIACRSPNVLWKSKGWIIGWGVIFALSYVAIVSPGFLRVQGCIGNGISTCFSLNDTAAGVPALVRKTTLPVAIQAAGVLPNASLRLLNPFANLWETYLNLDRTRTWNWGIALEMFRRNLLFGIGIGHFKIEYFTYKAKFAETEFGKQFDFYALRTKYAHNDYVQLAAEMGIGGVAAVVFLLLSLTWKGIWHLTRQTDGVKCACAIAMYAGSLAIFVDASVNFPAHLPASALSLMLLLGFAHSRYLYPDASEVSLTGWALGVPVVVVLLVGMVTSVVVYREFQANVHLDLGNRYYREGFPQVAEQQYRQALALTFAPGEVFYRLGGVNDALGKPEEAQRYFERSLSSFVTEQTFWNLAVINYQKQNFEAARKYLKILLAIKPQGSLEQDALRMNEELSQSLD